MARGFSKWVRKQEGYVEPMVKYYPLPDFNHGNEAFNEDRLREKLLSNSIVVGPNKWLSWAFVWKYSNQGHVFWKRVYEGNGNFELACEILRSWKTQLCP